MLEQVIGGHLRHHLVGLRYFAPSSHFVNPVLGSKCSVMETSSSTDFEFQGKKLTMVSNATIGELVHITAAQGASPETLPATLRHALQPNDTGVHLTDFVRFIMPFWEMAQESLSSVS